MAKLSPTQLAWRGRIESGLRLAQPLLDLVLVVGDRIARTVDRDELDSGTTAPPVRAGARTSLAPGADEVVRGR